MRVLAATLLSMLLVLLVHEGVATAAWAAADAAGQGQAPETSVRFTSVAVLIDSGATPLAAWQIELVDPSDRSRIVGIEGGQHPAFIEPASYDPAALQGGRIVLAGFSLDEDLPVGETRVATIHLEVDGPALVGIECTVEAAGDFAGVEFLPACRLVYAE